MGKIENHPMREHLNSNSKLNNYLKYLEIQPAPFDSQFEVYEPISNSDEKLAKQWICHYHASNVPICKGKE